MNATAAPLPAQDPRFHYGSTVAVGVDLGQSHDPTSIAVIEKVAPEIPADTHPPKVEALRFAMRSIRPKYQLRLLEQAPLGESYILQAHRLKRILARAQIAEHDPLVWIDGTGVGKAVVDIFRQERIPNLRPVAITFAGQEGPDGRGGHSVPKINLVSRVQAAMHTGCLVMPDTLPLAKTFRRELLDFRVSYSAVGNATFGAREGAHDDLILAVALAMYGLDSNRRVIVEPFPWGKV
ncbi:hypothetical protein IMW82_00840 [Rhodanobacter sp. B2A1Ga4]|uniref:hypothetical protein n=1 Tax=Rhodanobacter sp. B2A1Ga4 TaxID=2778647 RepID=UPI001B35C358|nr:hypothetical protein [Rhodanobacter sp. B2A1Ga4]MBQ4853227.1 hypothetical protein [Rhodanobacter sp. B2A1Ga4]